MVNQNEIINIATINLNGETWSSINRRPRLPQKLYDIQHIKEELTKSTKEGIKKILECDIYDIIAVQELVFSETYKILSDINCGMWEYGIRDIFDMWVCEKITGNPRQVAFLRMGDKN